MSKLTWLVLWNSILILNVGFRVAAENNYQDDEPDCKIDTESRECVKIYDCDEYIEMLKSKSPNIYSILKIVACGFDRFTPKVCCPVKKTGMKPHNNLPSQNNISNLLLENEVDLDFSKEEESDCTAIEDKPGICIVLNNCSMYMQLLQISAKNRVITDMLKDLQCGFDGLVPKVCCPLPENVKLRKILTTEPNFGSVELPESNTNRGTQQKSNNENPLEATDQIPNFVFSENINIFGTFENETNPESNESNHHIHSDISSILNSPEISKIFEPSNNDSNSIVTESKSVSSDIPEPYETFVGIPPFSTSTDSSLSNIPTNRVSYLLPNDCGCSEINFVAIDETPNIFNNPWVAFIFYNTSLGMEFACGGSIIRSRHILTAAQCVTNLINSTLAGVRIGKYDINNENDCENSKGKSMCGNYRDIQIKKVKIYPEYSSSRALNDIAIIELTEDIDFDKDHARPICLPFTEKLMNTPLEGLRLTAPGWKFNANNSYSPEFTETFLPVINRSSCDMIYKRYFVDSISHKQVCAGTADQRNFYKGFIGGPLQHIELINGKPSYVQYGIVSYNPRCDSTDIPGIHTKVSPYMDWILDQIEFTEFQFLDLE